MKEFFTENDEYYDLSEVSDWIYIKIRNKELAEIFNNHMDDIESVADDTCYSFAVDEDDLTIISESGVAQVPYDKSEVVSNLIDLLDEDGLDELYDVSDEIQENRDQILNGIDEVFWAKNTRYEKDDFDSFLGYGDTIDAVKKIIAEDKGCPLSEIKESDVKERVEKAPFAIKCCSYEYSSSNGTDKHDVKADLFA